MQITNVGAEGFNAYVISGEKTAVIDGVPEKYARKYIDNIKKATGRVDYLICNHASPHTEGSAAELLKEYPNIKIIASTAGMRNLKGILNSDFNELLAKDEMTLDLGGAELKFLLTSNLNWPDTMMTCCGDTVFSGLMFAGEYDYFKENFSAFKPFVKYAAERLVSVNGIYPCLGGKREAEIIEKYRHWAEEEQEQNVFIIYDSYYGYTHEMALEILEILTEYNIKSKVFAADDEFDINLCSALIIGTPTINQNASQKILAALSHINTAMLSGTPCFVFGAYGWGGEGVRVVQNLLKSMKLKTYKKPFAINFKMSESDKAALKKYTVEFIESNLN